MRHAVHGAGMGPLERVNEELHAFPDRRVPATRELVAEALRVCHDALLHELQGHDSPVDDKSIESWCRPVLAFAVFAARHNVPPERTLVAFKKMVSELEPVHRLRIDERDDFMRRLVREAIEAYYRDSPQPVRPRR